jgi:uncharacterized membrane protein YedE/YeeE
MDRRLAGLGIGLVFGVILSWSGMTSPDVIRDALLFEDSYLFLFFASAVVTAAIGLRLLRGGTGISWETPRPARRHIVGSLVFGLGWGLADACPGPVATQVGQGIGWGLFTLAGIVIGVYLYLRHGEETEPARDGPRLARGRSVTGAA